MSIIHKQSSAKRKHLFYIIQSVCGGIIAALAFFFVFNHFSKVKIHRPLHIGDVKQSIALKNGTYVYLEEGIAKDAKGRDFIKQDISMGTPDDVQVMVRSKYSSDPVKNLTVLHNLKITSTQEFLYFNSAAWSEQDAVHRLDLRNDRKRYITAGRLICVIANGPNKDDLIVEQRRHYKDKVGAYDAPFLIDPEGKEIKQISPILEMQGVKELITKMCQGEAL